MPKTDRKRIASEWNSFEKAVMPQNASAIQRKEMRRAFYAGGWAMLQIAKELGDENISEEQGVVVLESIEAEYQDFMKRVGVDF
jgi:hypothetical protein